MRKSWGVSISKTVFYFVLFFSPLSALADCAWNSDRSFFSCDTLGIASTVSRALPVASEGIRFNPASLPTVPSPAGVEATYSSRTEADGKFQVALIKGFSSFGLGLSSWSENSFATPNVQRALRTRFVSVFDDYSSQSNDGFRLGAALAIPLGALEKYFRVNGGASLGKGRLSRSSSTTYGLTLESRFLHLGYSKAYETISTQIPDATTATFGVGVSLEGLYLGFSRISYAIGTIEQLPIYLYSLRYADRRWAIYGALKRDADFSGNRDTDKTAGISRYVTDKLVLGYLYGLYPDSHSMTVQLYF